MLIHCPVVASCISMKQIPYFGRAIAPSAGSKVAFHASGYAPWMSTRPSCRSLMPSISMVSFSAHQDLTLQRICGSSVSPALWVTFFLISWTVKYSDPRILEGMTHAPTFNRSTTHLLCPAATGAKYSKAQVWETPVVDMRWLSHIARTGAFPPSGMFFIPDLHTRSAETTSKVKCPCGRSS
jgi:hypothetical protein